MTILDKNIHGSVSSLLAFENIEFIEISHTRCDAKLSLYGGQVLSWQPTGQKDVFWLSKQSEYSAGKAIRGGIPLCWPWFGGFKSGGNHGFARTQTWQLDTVNILAQGVEVVLIWQGQGIHDLWPNEAKLTQKLFFGDVFKQELIMENLTSEDVQYTGALHSYFSVSEPKNVTIERLNGVPFDCKLSGDKQITDQKRDMVGPMDRIYYSSDDMDIIDSGLNRKVTVSTLNTAQWVLWNPGQEVAESMKDLHLNSEDEFVCLEAANTQWQTIPASSSVSFAQEISVSSL